MTRFYENNSGCIEKRQVELSSEDYREYDFNVILGLIVFCRKLRWMCRKHSKDLARQLETPGKAIIFVARQIYPVAPWPHDFHVALEATLYHDENKYML